MQTTTVNRESATPHSTRHICAQYGMYVDTEPAVPAPLDRNSTVLLKVAIRDARFAFWSIRRSSRTQ